MALFSENAPAEISNTSTRWFGRQYRQYRASLVDDAPARPVEPQLRSIEQHSQSVESPNLPVEQLEGAQDTLLALRGLTIAGQPQIKSIHAIGPYKRVLTTGEEGGIRITAEARTQFVAIDTQAGMAIVVATQEFRETAQYATYLIDLRNAHFDIREELIAKREVVADIYESGKQTKAQRAVISNREIGTFRDIVEVAHSFGATDIHFEPRAYRADATIRFRVNGDLYTYASLPIQAVQKALAAAYQDLVQENTNSAGAFQETGPQSAMIPLVVGRDIVNLRWQSMNVNGGFDVALRLLDGNFKNSKVRTIEHMGWEPSQCKILNATTTVADGLTISCGPTGSGKTTLLRAMSYAYADRDIRKQFMISEPSEYPNAWLSEISVQRRPGESEESAVALYTEIIRTMMRMDPDDITVAEIRDHVVASLVMEIALTGHPVRTTVHARNIIEIFMRLMGGRLKLPSDEIASGIINAVISQRLVPVLCECALPAPRIMPADQLQILQRKFGLDTSKMRCRNDDGCSICRNEKLISQTGKVAAGTVGVTVVGEAYEPTDEFLEQIAARNWKSAEAIWRGERCTPFDDPDMRGKTYVEHALFKASGNAAQIIIDPRVINDSMTRFDRYKVHPISGIDA